MIKSCINLSTWDLHHKILLDIWKLHNSFALTTFSLSESIKNHQKLKSFQAFRHHETCVYVLHKRRIEITCRQIASEDLNFSVTVMKFRWSQNYAILFFLHEWCHLLNYNNFERQISLDFLSHGKFSLHIFSVRSLALKPFDKQHRSLQLKT